MENTIHLKGRIAQQLQFDHELFDEQFYTTTLCVPRTSGAEDFLPVTISERLLIGQTLAVGSELCVEGQLRTHNKIQEGSSRLVITAFAQQILNCEEDRENANQVRLTGTLCKLPVFRTTPFGREIADLMIAVNRAYGKSDYLPCIAWGRTARFAASLKPGDRVWLAGRFQSRVYQKQLPDGTAQNKTAYEVSAYRLALLRDEEQAVDV